MRVLSSSVIVLRLSQHLFSPTVAVLMVGGWEVGIARMSSLYHYNNVVVIIQSFHNHNYTDESNL